MYPKVMTAGPHQSVVVANEEQERALPAEYGGLAALAEPVAVSDLSKEELQALCDERGIEFDKRWGVARLLEALA
jgi:hypothetical protein